MFFQMGGVQIWDEMDNKGHISSKMHWKQYSSRAHNGNHCLVKEFIWEKSFAFKLREAWQTGKVHTFRVNCPKQPWVFELVLETQISWKLGYAIGHILLLQSL